MAAAAPTAPTRERILEAALDLFAERGFAGTTVGDIERAAGLTPRAGGLYKHFPSKEAVLRAALDRFVDSTSAVEEGALALLPLGDLRAELTLIGRATAVHFAAQGRFIRIVNQERVRFPELVAEMHRRAVAPAYVFAAQWIRGHFEARGLPALDAEALGAVAITPFVTYQIESDLFGEPPGGLEPERFVDAWVELMIAFIRGGGSHASHDS